MDEPQQYTEEDLEMMKEIQEEQAEDVFDENQMLNKEFAEGYPIPEPEEKINSAAFLNKAAFQSKDTVKTTYLSEGELGRPLFNVRFLLDMHDITKHYLDDMIKELNHTLNEEEKDKVIQIENRIANYFLEKVRNITDSGMSNKGFAMNLNVTRKMDSTRARVKDLPPQFGKGGKK